MSKIIKPIPTEYKGIKYKSRLEARWAVFFEELGIKAKYEPLTLEHKNIQYTPDFIIKNGCVNVEDINYDFYDKWFENPKNLLDDIYLSPIPDNIRHHLLIEIKPRRPNLSYIQYLRRFTLKYPYVILICVGNPSFNQSSGLLIYSQFIYDGFNFHHCSDCKLIDVYSSHEISNDNVSDDEKFMNQFAFEIKAYEYPDIHKSKYCQAVLGNHYKAAEKAKYYRFDLEE